MNAIVHLLSIITFLLSFLPHLCLAVAESPDLTSITTPSGAILHTSSDGFEHLTLPDTLITTHVAFNISHLLSLPPLAPLPQLPGVPPPSAAALPPPKFQCTTTPNSPPIADVLVNAAALYSIANNWCCQTGSLCTLMKQYKNAATNICNGDAGMVCVKCEAAALANYAVAMNCKKGGKASGSLAWGNVVAVYAFWKM